MLVAPLLVFVLITFLIPIGDMLFRSVENDIVKDTLPRTVVALRTWDDTTGSLPDEAVYLALAQDMKLAVAAKRHTVLGSRFNYEKSGMSSLFRKSGRRIKKWDLADPVDSYRDKFIATDKRWGDPDVWRIIKLYSPSYTPGYFLNALDLQLTPDGIEARPENQRIYIKLFMRTAFMSLTITFFCLLLGYPVAYLLCRLPMNRANILLIFVLLPFWTSLLVRTSAWKVLLQQQGVINDILVSLHLVDNAERLILINNQFGTIITMTHILLPFMILPLYSVMSTIPSNYVRAAKSLGATDFYAFIKVYFPLSVPGIAAGASLVFILSIGYYITPEIVGGTTGTFISNRIAYHISSSLNWGLGAALGAILLIAVVLFYYVYNRFFGATSIKLN